ncbi:ankyrin repeat-containing protein [Cystoisospora suis]|uniref:Ankyrin repeat-containing protein n=1 Tax=Cystoisospora suis TaxID=483139 RepID=A0A2C6KRI4_9APIC|nr:ankyrin repeat-containing protein [Cystoisospora suis]
MDSNSTAVCGRHCELAVHHRTLEKRIESVETVCAIPAFFDLKSDAKSQLPDWAKESEPFEEIVLQFREEIAAAKESGVATALISIAENEKLSKLETLLIELKRIEEEQRMKKVRPSN